jgi:hypothetical protein
VRTSAARSRSRRELASDTRCRGTRLGGRRDGGAHAGPHRS